MIQETPAFVECDRDLDAGFYMVEDLARALRGGWP
jgi:hypothetical protein